MITITLPEHRARTRVIAGIPFTDGIATVKRLAPSARRYLGLIGATIETVKANPLEGLRVTELREHAAEQGIDLPAGATKAEIIATIDAAN